MKSPLSRHLGSALVIVGLAGLAVLVPVRAWLSRDSASSFNQYVGWSNVLSMSVGILGVVLVILDRVMNSQDESDRRLTEVADTLAGQVLRTEGRQLAQLLGTDDLDSRSAELVMQFDNKVAKIRTAKGAAKKNSVVSSQLVDYFLSATSGCLLILGAPGTGKTVTALKIVTDLAMRRREQESGRLQPVPVVFHLPSWPRGEGFEDWLSDSLSDRFGLDRRLASALVTNGFIMPVLDALDEVQGEVEGDRLEGMLSSISQFAAVTVGVKLIVTCRTTGRSAQDARRRLRKFDVVTLQPVALIQIEQYIAEHLAAEELELWKPVFAAMRSPNSMARSLLSTPWRLSMAVVLSRDGGDPASLLPLRRPDGSLAENKARYTWRVEQMLYSAFVDARSRHHGKRPVTTLIHLCILAKALTTAPDSASRGAGEIVLHEWWKVVGEKRVLLHVAVLFFAFLQLVLLSVLHFGGSGIKDRESPLLYFGMLVGNVFLLATLTSRAIAERVSPMRLRLSTVRNARGYVGLVATVAVSVMFGAVGYFGVDRFYGAALGAAMMFLSVLITLATSSGAELPNMPGTVLADDIKASVLVGAGFAAVNGVYYTELVTLSVGICFGVAYFVATIISSSAMKYWMAIYVGAVPFGMPFRLNKFLRWSCSAGLLRISGVGYQFRHDGLFRYLVSLTDAH